MAEISTRESYGKTLVELGKENKDIVVLDADLAKSTMTMYFAQEFPQRFFDCGLAEQNMIGIAAGLAATGKIPFASTFAIFASCRCFDQARMSLGQQHLNIKVVSTHSGVSVGEDGASHHAIEDLALYGSLVGIRIIVPADAIETAAAIRFAASNDGPFYIRLSRPKSPVIFPDTYKFVPDKAIVLKEGNDATIIAMGLMVSRALEAAEMLRKEKINCRVINIHTFKPLDKQTILQAAKETGAIVTVEEHLLHGGLGSEVSRMLAGEKPTPVEFVGINDVYTKSGTPEELLKSNGLTAENIAMSVKKVIKRK